MSRQGTVENLLDQLDSRLSRMQAELPRNPDTRPLPSGWVAHFEPQRRVWYYIHLDAAQPRATFVHPDDESDRDSPILGYSSSSSSSSRSSYSTNSTISPNRTRSPPATTAQQLYASSFEFGSKSPRPHIDAQESAAVSSGDSTSTSNPEPAAVAAVAAATVVAKSPSHPTSTRSSPGPALSVLPNSRDPRVFFDLTRPTQGTRTYRHDSETSPSPPSASLTATPLPSEAPPLATAAAATAASGELPSGRADETPSNPASSSGPISLEAQALYNPSIIVSNPSRPVLADRHNYSASTTPLGLSRNNSARREKRRPLPIHENYKVYTAITEDETLKVAPIPSTVSPNTPGLTEDNLLVLPAQAAPKRDSRLLPINVDDVQNPPESTDSQGEPQVEERLLRASSVSHLHVIKKRSVRDAPVIEQPRPIIPLNGLPAHLSTQLGKGKERRSYGFSAIFETMDRLARRDSGIFLNEDT